MKKTIFLIALSITCTISAHAQFYCKTPSKLKKLEWSKPVALDRGTDKILIDSVVSESYYDSIWIEELRQFNYYRSDCLIERDSLSWTGFDNGEFRPFFLELYAT